MGFEMVTSDVCPCVAKSLGRRPFTDLWGHMTLNGAPVCSERPASVGFAVGEPPPQAVPAQGVLEKSPAIATGSKTPMTENIFPKQLKAPERGLFLPAVHGEPGAFRELRKWAFPP